MSNKSSVKDLFSNFKRKKSIPEILKYSVPKNEKLEKTLGYKGLIIIGISVSIGAGIFTLSVQQVANSSGPATILSIALAGVIYLFSIMCFAEFAMTFKSIGSPIEYTHAAFGELPATLMTFCSCFQYIGGFSMIIYYWNIYFVDMLKMFGVNIPYGISFTVLGHDVLIYPSLLVMLAVLGFVCLQGAKRATRVMSVLTVLKVLVILFIIVVGFFFIKGQNFIPFIPEGRLIEGAKGIEATPVSLMLGGGAVQFGLPGILLASSVIIFSFGGYEALALSSEETVDPHKNIPKGMVIGFVIVVTLNILVATVVSGMVHVDQLQGLHKTALSVVDVFSFVNVGWIEFVIGIGSFLCLTSVSLGMCFAAPRIILAASRSGILPKGLRKISKKHSPYVAQIVFLVLVAIVSHTVDIIAIAGAVSFSYIAQNAVVNFALFKFRKIRNDAGLKVDYQVRGGKYMPIFIGCVTSVFILFTQIQALIVFFAVIAFAFVYYFVYAVRFIKREDLTMDDVVKTKKVTAKKGTKTASTKKTAKTTAAKRTSKSTAPKKTAKATSSARKTKAKR